MLYRLYCKNNFKLLNTEKNKNVKINLDTICRYFKVLK